MAACIIAPTAAGPRDDARLLALGAEFTALDAEQLAAQRSMADAAFAELSGRWWGVVDAIIGTEATTPAGLQVKARVLVALIQGASDVPSNRMGLSLAGDLIGGGL